MNFIESAFLGLIQGITEFLPISSSGHLVMIEEFFSLEAEKLVLFDLILHMGTFLSVFIYFRKDIFDILRSVWKFFMGKVSFSEDKNLKLSLYIVLGSIPAVLAGLLFKDQIEGALRNIETVSIMFLIVAVLFIVAEIVHKKNKTSGKGINFKSAIFVGIMQAFALIPGISRSGATISAGIISGIDREESARFSFLLGLVIILGAGIFLGGLELSKSGFSQNTLSASNYLIGFLTSFIAGYFSIKFLMKLLKKHSLIVFSAYLIILSISLIIFY